MSSSTEINRHYIFKYFGYLEDASLASLKTINVESLQRINELAKSQKETMKKTGFLYKVTQIGRGSVTLKMLSTKSFYHLSL